MICKTNYLLCKDFTTQEAMFTKKSLWFQIVLNEILFTNKY